MRRRLFSLVLASMLLPVAYIPLAAEAQTPSTLVDYQSAGWRYQVVSTGSMTGFEATNFDDSGFGQSQGAFGSGGNCPSQQSVNTDWPINNDLLVRREFDFPAGATNITIHGGVDNSITVYWNGTQISQPYNHEGCSQIDSFTFSVPDSLVTTGKNVLAVRAGDHGIESFLDLKVTGVVGEECESRVTDGYFEPAQVVWQDDALVNFTPDEAEFPDLEGKQLYRYPFDDEVRYNAELPMVRGKASALFGIDHSVGGPAPMSRYQIAIEITTDCTEEARTRIRFTLDQGGQKKTIGTSDHLGDYDLTGPAGEEKTYNVFMPVPNGFPDQNFTFDAAGSYTISGEIFSTTLDGPTGLKVDVDGTVVDTSASRVGFLPIADKDNMASQIRSLEQLTERMAEDSRDHVPDMFPLNHGGFPTSVLPTENIASFTKEAIDEWRAWLQQLTDFTSNESIFSEVRLAIIDRRFAAYAQQNEGLGRIVAVFSDGDFNRILPPRLRDRAGGFTSSSKFIGVPSEAPWQVIAHEYAHSVPAFLWSKHEMLAECTIDYHNTVVTDGGMQKPLKIAHGYRLTRGPDSAVREKQDPKVSIMGPQGSWTPWMDQCTYWHLVKVLQQPIDPPTLVVSGRLGRSPTAEIGELFPMYQMDGIVDLAEGTDGEWAFVLKDASGAELSRHPFEPEWTLADETVTRNTLAFSYRLPDLEETASIDLVGPRGVLDTRVVSANAPTVNITKPADGARARVKKGKVTVVWSGSDADGDELLYTVTYSTNGGRTWQMLALERAGTSIRIPVRKKTKHMVRVMVTDGASSAMDEVSYRTPR